MTEKSALNDALWKHYKQQRDRMEIEAVALREEAARLTSLNAELSGKLAKAQDNDPSGAAEKPAAPSKAKRRG